MAGAGLVAALEREHREIDRGVAEFTAAPGDGAAILALKHAIDALRRHIYLEEEFLFPAIHAGAGEGGGLFAPLLVMLREHGQMWPVLDSLDRELNALAGGAADTGPALLLCRQLSVQLQHHNLKEERIVYPTAEGWLTDSATGLLERFGSTRTIPSGWICHKAPA